MCPCLVAGVATSSTPQVAPQPSPPPTHLSPTVGLRAGGWPGLGSLRLHVQTLSDLRDWQAGALWHSPDGTKQPWGQSLISALLSGSQGRSSLPRSTGPLNTIRLHPLPHLPLAFSLSTVFHTAIQTEEDPETSEPHEPLPLPYLQALGLTKRPV